MNKKAKIITKRILAFLLVGAFILSTVSIAFAKDAEVSEELSDEEWEAIKDEMVNLDDDPDWDHETWDEDHKELVWTVFASTSWNEDSFPNLNFSTMDGVASVSVSHLSEDEQNYIRNLIQTYKYTTGAYSKKTTTDSGTTVDNSAYIPIVMIAMDTLKAKGSGNDPFATNKYLSRNKKTGLISTYDTSKRSDEQVLRSVTLEVYRRLVNAEKYYNTAHGDSKANVYQKTSDGLLVMLQAVTYNTIYPREVDSYSESSASDWFKDSSRKKDGYTEYSDFALNAVAGYDCAESLGEYIMDGFGYRVDSGG